MRILDEKTFSCITIFTPLKKQLNMFSLILSIIHRNAKIKWAGAGAVGAGMEDLLFYNLPYDICID